MADRPAKPRCGRNVEECSSCKWRGGNIASKPCIKCGGIVIVRACKKYPALGTKVCDVHGAKAPQVVAAAKGRILEAADEVAAELIRLALNSNDHAVRVRAARDLLDRAGLMPKQIIEAEVTHHDGDSKLDAEIEALLTQMAERER